MVLAHVQIIQSLGEAMSWFERELGWGVSPTELRHLSGRIGELYAALFASAACLKGVSEQSSSRCIPKQSLGTRITSRTIQE